MMGRVIGACVVVACICLACIPVLGVIQIWRELSPPQPHRATCLASHREVVLIPTVCGNHDICQRPIVTEVCDRVEMSAPRPEYRGKYE